MSLAEEENSNEGELTAQRATSCLMLDPDVSPAELLGEATGLVGAAEQLAIDLSIAIPTEHGGGSLQGVQRLLALASSMLKGAQARLNASNPVL